MIYMDNAATTPVYQEVIDVMVPYFGTFYGNPSSIYQLAAQNKEQIEKAREIIAKSLHAKPNEIYFTSGGTESDNWVLENAVINYGHRGKHIITTRIEHHAMLHKCGQLAKKGYEITYLNVDRYGMINVNELERAIRNDTILISVMYANNEVGTIEPIEIVGGIARKYQILFHTDAVQAYGHVPIDVKAMNIDFLSASAHKFHGPKGVGFLYAREDCELSPMIFGGAQERQKRAGTENVPGIAGMAKAAQICCERMAQTNKELLKKRDYFILRILKEIPLCQLQGHYPRRLPGNVNIGFRFVDAGSLLVLLDFDGICASAGSACSTGNEKISHVLAAMGIGKEYAFGTIRFTLGEEVTMEEIDFVVDCLKKHIVELRKKSEEYENYMMRRRW